MGAYEGSHIIQAIREIRNLNRWELRPTLIWVAEEFGFPCVGTEQLDNTQYAPSLNGWREFTEWRRGSGISFEAVQGPHSITILKAIAARHGRKRASTGRS